MTRQRTGFVTVLVVVVLMGCVSVCRAAEAAPAAEPPVMKGLPLASRNTILLIRATNVEASVKAAAELVASFQEEAQKQDINKMVDELLGELKGVDRTGPAALLIMDPKKFKGFPVSMVGVFHLKDPDQFKTIIDNAKVRVIGKLGIISDGAEALAEVGDAIQAAGIQAIPVADMTDMVVINTNVSDLLKRYKPDIQGLLHLARVELGEKMPGMEPDPDEAAAPAEKPDPNKVMALKALDYLSKLIEETEKQAGPVELGLNLNMERGTARLAVTLAADSPAAKYLARNNRPVNLALASFLPADSYVTTIGSSDPEAGGELVAGMVRIAGDIFSLNAEETNAMVKAITDLSKNLSGLQASAQVATKDGMAGVSLYGIQDTETARQNMKALVALTKGGALGELLAKYGISVKVDEKHRESNGIPVDKIEAAVDMDKLAAALLGEGDRGKAEMKKGLGDMLKMAYGNPDKVVMEVAYGKKLAAMVFGADYQASMDKQIVLMKDGPGGIGTLAEYQAAVARHPKESVAVGTFSLFGYADALGKMMGKMAFGAEPQMNMFPTRAELPPNDSPMSFSVRIDGSTATMYVDVPLQPIRVFADVMKKKMKKMMEDMMNAPPGGGAQPEELDNF